MDALDMRTAVETPERLAFRVEVAGLARRSAAWGIDPFLRGGILLVFTYFFGVTGTMGDEGLAGFGAGALFLLVFTLTWLYYVVCEVLSGGRSPGKAAFGLRVVGTDGLPITLRQSILRSLGRAADLVFAAGYLVPVGVVVILIEPRARRIGDLLAGTMVVVEATGGRRRRSEPPVVRLDDIPLRPRLERDEVDALEAFVRRGALTSDRRRELAELLAPELARRHGVPPPSDPTAYLVGLWTRVRGAPTGTP